MPVQAFTAHSVSAATTPRTKEHQLLLDRLDLGKVGPARACREGLPGSGPGTGGGRESGGLAGTTPDGLIVEFEGTIVGPKDPGIVIGPGGTRFVLGDAEKSAEVRSSAAGSDGNSGWGLPQVAAAVSSVAVAVVLFLTSGGLQNVPFVGNGLPPGSGPVTRTNITIVETRTKQDDGTSVKVTDKITRRERLVPGQAPRVTETTTRTEKILKDQRTKRLTEAPKIALEAPET
ncbi:unnamed protein product [Prorocentrum cordatum]|uniref:DUF2382 domain-containing protein n=1 Tax=Prorocentrum cordatum TaxID=2364126 RepID=A0ABN9W3S8_9DINO|nr:unnamed protein product [Polarella glacialis]